MCCYKRTDTVEIGTPRAERGLRTVQVEAAGHTDYRSPRTLEIIFPVLCWMR
jgi:hypothetical protein